MLLAEYAGLGLWTLSLLFIRRPPSWLVLAWHLVQLALSFAASALLLQDARAPFNSVLLVAVLGVLNGLLGAAWCGSIEPAVSKLPLAGITLAGLASAVFLALTSGPLIRLF